MTTPLNEHIVKRIILLVLIIAFQTNLQAQKDTLAVKTIEGITDKMLELISGDVGEARDWEEYRSLFLPTAQKMFKQTNKQGKSRVLAMNLEQFIRNVGPLYKRDGFEEYAIGLTVNEFNGMANVFQSYYSKNLKGTYEKRGINSYQLVHSNGRWWIASTMFTHEAEDTPLPDKYLSKKSGQE
ncbi:hypothetical protein WIW50_12055 [Flavobacteriaceae bacterium 3-367]|uniref:hypothetical protein n=1 Tax=Eudoraea algarum TaxID=3417568 RepID=UPI003282EDCE